MTTFRWQINWRLTAFSTVFLALFFYLSGWQFQRAEEKQAWIDEQQRRAEHNEVKMLSAKVSDVELHQSVSMTGRMETSHYWLVEGRVLEGRLGYDVVMPFESEFGWVLLDRGWIEEAQLHELTFPNGISTVLAIREEPTDLPLIDENNNTLVNWPHRIVEVDAQVLARQLGLNTALPYFRLLPESAHVLTYRERKLRVSPARHQGYAVQWLLMGLALCVAWFFASSNLYTLIKKKK